MFPHPPPGPAGDARCCGAVKEPGAWGRAGPHAARAMRPVPGAGGALLGGSGPR